MDPRDVCFLVNNEIVNLCPQDDAVRGRLLVDHLYATKKIAKYVNEKRIKLNEPISRIALLHNDTEQLIYEVDTNSVSDNENIEPIEQNIIEDSVNAEQDFGQSQSSPGTSQVQNDAWGEPETKYILDQYYEYMTQIGPMKMFRRKKDMWSRISSDFLEKYGIYKTPLQIANRYKTVLRRKKGAVDNNAKSRNSRQEVPYEEELQKIARLDDSIEPEVIRSAKRVRILKESQFQNIPLDSDDDDKDHEQQINNKRCNKRLEEKQRKTKRNLNTAQLIKMLHAEKEIAKQRRHEEKMQLLRELFGNMQDDNADSV